jgi:hypothetical protein
LLWKIRKEKKLKNESLMRFDKQLRRTIKEEVEVEIFELF